jgi:L-ascorbate metabolism protein UlaG (beta-lactamase superfamily)
MTVNAEPFGYLKLAMAGARNMKANTMLQAFAGIRRLLIGLLLAMLANPGPLSAQPAEPRITPFNCKQLSPAPVQPNAIRVMFLGVSTLLFDDGETQFMTDGFFSRPDIFTVGFGKIEPNLDRISRGLQKAGVSRLSAVFPLHTHYDHALDSAEIAKRTGALLMGSESTANLGRGWGLLEERLRLASPGDSFTFGRLQIDVVRSRHSGGGSDGTVITRPLKPPVSGYLYAEGGTYALLVKNANTKLLIGTPVESPNVRADVVFLGLAAAGIPGSEEDYWREVWQRAVVATQAKRVIATHWDNFFLPLDWGLQPLWLPDVGKVLQLLQRFGQESGVDVACMPLWEKIDPLAGLTP